MREGSCTHRFLCGLVFNVAVWAVFGGPWSTRRWDKNTPHTHYSLGPRTRRHVEEKSASHPPPLGPKTVGTHP